MRRWRRSHRLGIKIVSPRQGRLGVPAKTQDTLTMQICLLIHRAMVMGGRRWLLSAGRDPSACKLQDIQRYLTTVIPRSVSVNLVLTE